MATRAIVPFVSIGEHRFNLNHITYAGWKESDQRMTGRHMEVRVQGVTTPVVLQGAEADELEAVLEGQANEWGATE